MARNVTLQRVAPSPANNSSNGAFAGGVFTPTADNAIADIDQVETLLNAGTSVDIRTIDATGTQAGDIIVAGNETITKTGTGIATLRLNAEDDIFIDGGVTIQQSGGTLGTDKLNIVVNADSDASTTSRGGIYLGFAVAASVTLSTNGGNISFGGRDTTLAGTVGDATTFATGSGTGSVSSTGIFIRSSTLSSGGGAISMAGHGFAGGLASRGIIIQEGSDINAAGGAITLTGVGGAGQFDCYGVLIGSAAATQVRTTGTGTITITGTGGASTGNDDHGVVISAQAVVSAVNGAITITGTAGGGGGAAQGIRLTQDASITSTGTGAISLTGTGAGSGPGSEGIALNVDSIGNSLAPGGTVTIGGASASGFISLKSLSGSDVAIGGASGSATIQTTGSVLVEAQGGGIITLASGSHIIGGITGVTLRADDIALADTVNVGNGGGTAGLTSHTASREIDVGTDTAGKLGITDAELDLLNAGAIIIGDGAHTGAITVSADINPATAQNIRLWNNTGGIALGANVTVTQSLEIRADLNGTTGAITHTAGTLTAQQMILSAATGIGSAGGAGAVFTSALTLDAQNTGATGNINIVESNGLTLGALKQTDAANTLGTVALTSTTGNIGLNNSSVLSQGGLITLTATAGAITDADGGTVASIINASGQATLTAAIGIGNAADRLEVQVGTLRATNTGSSGGIFITESDSVTLAAAQLTGAANTAGEVALRSGGSISLNNGAVLSLGGLITLTATAGAITDADGGTAVSITNASGQATLTAATGIGTAADRLEVQVDTLSATNTGSSGGIFITEWDSVTLAAAQLTDAANTTGEVALRSGGSIRLSDGAVLAQGGLITLTATAGAITDADGGTAASLTNASGQATLTATTGIGSAGAGAIDTQVATLSASNTVSGDIVINEADGVDITTVSAIAGFSLTAGGPVTVTGTVTTGSGFTLSTGSAATIADGAVAGGGGFNQNGAGTTTINGTQTYSGATTINGGILLVDGSIAASSGTTVNITATLGGHGTVGAVTVASGGTLSPGASAGRLTANGDVAFSAGGIFKVELGGTTAGIDYDQLTAGGAVNLNGATLNGSLLGDPAFGTEYKIIDKTSAGAVSGTFNGTANGSTVAIGGRAFQIDYAGGDGNDVTLALGALKISGTDPVNVLADVDATTTSGVNLNSPTQSVATTQIFDADVTGAVNAGVTVNGRGLSVDSTKAGGTVDFVNSGAITVDDPSTPSNAGLTLLGGGGGIHYSGNGTISAPGVGLFVGNTGTSGGTNLVEVGGTISGSNGIRTLADTTAVVVSGTVIGTGGTAVVFGATSSNNTIDLKPSAVITGNLLGSGNDDSIRLSGVAGIGTFDLDQIAGGFSTLRKAEGATWTVTGTFADPNAATIVINGTLLVNGTIGGGVTVGTNFTETLPVPPPVLGGTGSVGNLLMQDKGVLAPGAGAGTLTVTGNLTMLGGSTLQIEIGGTGAGQFDVLNVNGTAVDTGAIELGGATLTGSLIGGFTPSLGQVFKIIDNAGSDAIASPFSGIGEGAGVNFGGRTFTVSYVGGDGNDVTLTAVGNGAPGLTGVGPSVNVTQAGPAATPQVLDGDVLFTDVEGNFAGGALIVTGVLAEDTVGVPSVGTDPGEFLIVENGAVDRLFFEGTEIGGISGGTGTTLNITFNGNATTGIVDTLIQNLTFLDTSANPTFSRTLVLNVMDSALASTGPKPLLVRVFNGDIAFGSAADDSFAPTGNAHIDAGGGNDTITFDFRLVDATVTYSGNQVIIDAPSRHMVLSGFETYKFTDGTVNNNDGDVLVDDLFYYSKYHDVWTAHADADAHYHTVGWKEGRDPDAFFSTVIYLSANPDVKAAAVDPLNHFDTSGWKEGRVPSVNFDPAAYLAANPDVKAAGVDPLAHFLQFGAGEGRQPIAPTELIGASGFDYVFYLNHNPDVAAAGVDPLQHFQQFGWKEGRNPNALFDTTGYLNNYLDVKAANVNPLDHYNQFGWHEGRDPSVGFDTTSYLAAYPDVAAANINPLTHFLHFGIHEGRSPFADGLWG